MEFFKSDSLREIEQELPDPHQTIIAALIILLLINAPQFSYEVVIFSAVVAIFVAIMTDGVMTYLKSRNFISSQTSMITALIIINIFRPDEFLFIAVATFLAILLKNVIRFDNSPIFNPAALGLFIAFRLVSNPLASEIWWGNNNTIAVILLGLIVAWRIHKLTISFSFLLTNALISYLRFGIDALAFFPFFSAFFMLTEPKTSPHALKKQIIFGAFAAVAIHVFAYFNLPSVYILAILYVGILKFFLGE